MRFKLTMPMEDPRRVEAAWAQSRKDVKVATALLSDVNWSPPAPIVAPIPIPAPGLSPSPNKDAVGRVKEVDEATKAQRIATKELGKKSAIYANRTTLDTVQFRHYTPPQPVERTLSSPAPRIMPRKRITRKLVVDSDSEPNYTDSDDELQNRSRPDDTERYGLRALAYFNTSSSEALQELTGQPAFFLSECLILILHYRLHSGTSYGNSCSATVRINRGSRNQTQTGQEEGWARRYQPQDVPRVHQHL
jgi:SWI/SNF-related matrix-associated actin-dependent regulator 1 of chromatin subfamily A